MKMERINDNQIKVIMNADDLRERNLTLSEVAYGSEKGQALFDDVMTQAKECYNFYFDENHPIIIEAIPMSKTDIIFIISKITQFTDFSSTLSFVPQMKPEHKPAKQPEKTPARPARKDNNILIYVFNELDDVISASKCVSPSYDGENMLYKMDRKYYLIAHPGFEGNPENALKTFNAFETMIADYGKKHTSTMLAKMYILEYGEVILRQAVQKFINM